MVKKGLLVLFVLISIFSIYFTVLVSASCDPACSPACSAGQSEWGASCGDCQTMQRTCDSVCNWGGWACVWDPPSNYGNPCGNCGTIDCGGSCTGQGVCSPSSKQCSGNTVQTCTSSCGWSNTQNCDASDGWYCSGSTRQYRNYGCSGGSCTYSITSSENCATKASVDSDGSSTAYTTAGRVTDYLTCSGGSCTSTSINDVCSGTVLTERGASGSSYVSNNYQCQNYESNYCSGTRYYRKQWGCSGSLGYCNDAAVGDTLIGTDADNDGVDAQCGDSLCDNNPSFVDSNRQCNAGQTQCDTELYQTCSNCAWLNSGTDNDNDLVDAECEDSDGGSTSCDLNLATAGICYTAVPGKCVAISGNEASCTDGLDNDCNGQADAADSYCEGTIQGTVTDTDGNPIEGARVSFVDENLNEVAFTFTDANGNYGPISLPFGNYHVTASHPDYVSQVIEVDLTPRETMTVNFGQGLGGEGTIIEGPALVKGSVCEDDCTNAGDNIVHADCDGINGCNFYDEQAALVCDNSQPRWIRDYSETQKIECAEGSPYERVEVEVTVTCEKENLIKMTRLVNYQGKLVKMIVVMCG